MINISNITSNVNSPFSDYIPAKQKHKHPLIDQSMRKEKKINEKTHACLYYLIVKSRDSQGDEFSLSNSYLVKAIDRTLRSISRYIKELEEYGYISKRSVINSNGKECRTRNYYTIQWMKLEEDFGESLFTDFLDHIVSFIRRQIALSKRVFSSLCRTFCLTNKPISKDIDSSITIPFFNEDAFKKEPPPDPEEKGIDRTYFNPKMTQCPPLWRTIAHEEQFNPIYIDEEFTVFRDYWLSIGQKPYAKRSDWTLIWRRRIRDIVNHPMTAYKRLVPSSAQDARKNELQALGKNFSLLPWRRSQSPSKPSPRGKEASDDALMPWREDLIRDAIMAPYHGMDISKFNTFYLEKAAHVKDTKKGWLERCHQWHQQNRDSMKLDRRIPETKIDLRLPDEERDINRALLKEIGSSLYIAWVQETPVVKQDDRYVIKAKTLFQANKFKEPHLSDALRKCNVDVLTP